jgi:signal transduction histidine kinase
MTIKEIQPEEDIPALLKFVDEKGSQSQYLREWRHRKKNGEIIQVEVVACPLVFNGRQALLVVVADVTEKKLLQEKFLHVQRLETLGLLAAGIAHDLNNMLAPIIFTAPLLRDSATTPRDLKILDTLERSANRGAGLVRQILAFTHSTTGEPQLTQIKHVARDIIDMVEETFPKSIQIEQHISSDVWPVMGNPTQLHQVFLNLCVNARDAMPQGGTLCINMANRRLNEEEARAIPGALPGAWLVIEVTDTGTGIPPKYGNTFGSHSLPPRALGRAPAWGSPPCMASSSVTTG